MSNAGSGFVHSKGSGETTEWDDILRKKGIIPEDPFAIAKAAEEAVLAMAEDAKERVDPLAHLTTTEIDELEEDDEEYGDSRALDAYREARVAEMKSRAVSARFGGVYELARVDFVREVNDASADGTWVVIHLHQDYIEDSNLLARAFADLARAHPAVKCMVSKADACVERFPDKNVPTLLLYRHGELQGQMTTLKDLGGARVNKEGGWGGGSERSEPQGWWGGASAASAKREARRSVR